MKKSKCAFIYFLVIFIFSSLPSCKNEEKIISGNSKPKTEERKITDFKKIDLRGEFTLNIKKGEINLLEITADENLLPEISSFNEQEVLYLKNKENTKLKTEKPIEINLTATELKEIAISGLNKVNFQNISNESLLIKNLGELDISLNGKTRLLEIDSSGSLKLKAKELYAEEVKINSGGISEITLTAEETLRADISGKGKMDYYGSPENLSINKAGKIEVIKQNDG